jgi:hypothetical protein
MSGRPVLPILAAATAVVLLALGVPAASGGAPAPDAARSGFAFAPGDLIVTGRGVRWLRADGSLVRMLEPESVVTTGAAMRARGGPRPLYVVHEPLVTRNYDSEGNFLYFFVLDPIADRSRAVALGPGVDGYVATSHGPLLNQIYGFREDPNFGAGAALMSFFVVASEINDLEVGADGCSLFVGTRTLGAFRFDACRFTVLPPLAQGLDVRRVRLLPDASALLVLGGQTSIRRIDANGQTIREYSAAGAGGGWAGIDLAPDGRSFWAVTPTGALYRFDLATGAIVQGPIQVAASATDLAVAGAPLGVAPPAGGTVPSLAIDLDGVKPLTGETFAGYFPPRRTPEKSCTPSASQLEFTDGSGVAIGPYPGPFSVRGSVSIGAQSGRALGGLGQPAGPVRSAQISFTLRSGDGVTGKATANGPVSANIANCSTFMNRTFPRSPIFPPDYPLSGYEWTLSAELLAYEVTIVKQGRSYVDTGRSFAFASRFFLLDRLGRDSGSGGRYAQYFVSESIGVKDSFRRKNQKQRHTAGVPPKTQAVDVVTRWSGSNAFTISDIRLVGPAGAGDAARASPATKPKVHITRTRNSVTARVSGLRQGRLEFAVKAEKVSTGGAATTTVRKARPRRGGKGLGARAVPGG